MKKILWKNICICSIAFLAAGTVSVTALAAETANGETQNMHIDGAEEDLEESDETRNDEETLTDEESESIVESESTEESDGLNIATFGEVALQLIQEEPLIMIEGIKENLPSNLSINNIVNC